MSSDVLLFVLSIVLGGMAFVALRQRDAARREAERCKRLARVGASVEGLAHDLNNIFTSIPYVVEEAFDLDDDEQRHALQRELEHTLSAGSRLLQELMRYVDGGRMLDDGSVAGVVRLVAASLRYRGPKIVLRIEGDIAYGADDLELLERVREIMTEAVEAASTLERAIVRVELTEEGLLIEHPEKSVLEDGLEVVDDLDCGWSLVRRVMRQGDDTVQVRLELIRSEPEAS